MNPHNPIAVLDSGIGGLTVLREIIKLLPHENTVYLADTANCPYGTKNFEQIKSLTEAAIKILIAQNAKIIVLACNTMTAAAVVYLRQKYSDTIFVGMEPAVKPAAKLTRSGVIGILATQATLRGGIYNRTTERIRQDIKIIETAGTGLVELIEQGDENSEQCYELTKSYIQPMIEQGVDNLVLGCTHYPFLEATINRITQGKLNLINPAPAIAKRVESLLQNTQGLNSQTQTATHRYISSGTAADLENLRQRSSFATGDCLLLQN